MKLTLEQRKRIAINKKNAILKRRHIKATQAFLEASNRRLQRYLRKREKARDMYYREAVERTRHDEIMRARQTRKREKVEKVFAKAHPDGGYYSDKYARQWRAFGDYVKRFVYSKQPFIKADPEYDYRVPKFSYRRIKQKYGFKF